MLENAIFTELSLSTSFTALTSFFAFFVIIACKTLHVKHRNEQGWHHFLSTCKIWCIRQFPSSLFLIYLNDLSHISNILDPFSFPGDTDKDNDTDNFLLVSLPFRHLLNGDKYFPPKSSIIDV